MSIRVLLSLGSNLGDRAANLDAALDALDQLENARLTAVSHRYETEPVGNKDQPAFLNLAAEIETDLEPLELLDAVKAIERRLGRNDAQHQAPRVIDIDLVLWGPRVMASDRLTLPHKELRNRAFVLTPLAEIAPQAMDPVSGMTVTELAQRPEARGRVSRLATLGH